MAGSAIQIIKNAPEFKTGLEKVANRFGSPKPALEIIGETVTASVQRNFEKGGRPDGWQALSEVTLAKKKGGSTLVGKGFGGGLLGSIHHAADENAVYIGTDKIYGAIHQFGGKAGRNKKVEIPQREFLVIQDEDVAEIDQLLGDFLLTGALA